MHLDPMNHRRQNSINVAWSIVDYGFIVILIALCVTSTHSDTFDNDKPVFSNSYPYAIDDCIPLAWGDFNADRIIDVFCRNSQGNSIRVMLNDDQSSNTKEQFRSNIT
jgi:hypothetical protein